MLASGPRHRPRAASPACSSQSLDPGNLQCIDAHLHVQCVLITNGKRVRTLQGLEYKRMLAKALEILIHGPVSACSCGPREDFVPG